MLLCTSLGFLSTQFPKRVHAPAERIAVSLMAVEFVESFELRIRDDEVCRAGQSRCSKTGNRLEDTLKVTLDPSWVDTLWNNSGTTLDSPRDQQSRRIFAQSFGNFDHDGVIDDSVWRLVRSVSGGGFNIPWSTEEIVAQRAISNR